MSPELEFYKTLNQTLSLFPEIVSTYLFCPLPFHSYHVTLWDGINDANVQNVSREYRFDGEDLLQDLSNSFLNISDFFEVDGQPLKIIMEEPIEFQFDKLIKWGNSVLVARLKPSNANCEIRLKKIEKQRENLIKKYKERFGLETCLLSYSPHVSLGYFANKELAELSTPMIEYWNEQFLLDTRGLTITFYSNSLYGFNNMATFFKK
ncbi:hypothetical protein KZ483_14690 [Paenibacillus sp. sptzw28]|uniref:hypothetical protein n=1 Tax=Paenibacillus sp. sptzw28 TaxID=715179 RepID=UPI001C6E004E|nr:hypothetical protein [Paenibacillus sp. sptzw28]QYR19201.1 hypothetical protein KZ483_14690 [Paenibacillus sp. sptzw28]